MDDPQDPWTLGCEAGVEYFNDGVLRGIWKRPDSNPFEKGSDADEKWLDGFSFGEDAAESSWES